MLSEGSTSPDDDRSEAADPSIADLANWIEASQGWRLRTTFFSVERMYRVFRGNNDQLLRTIALHRAGEPIPIFWSDAPTDKVQVLFTGAPLVQFVQGMRHYVLHYELPTVKRHFWWKEGETGREILLDRSDLRT